MATRTEFSWQDPFFLDQQLTSEEHMIRDAARDYCQDGLATRVLEANREEVFDREIMNEFGALGLLGATIPEKYGCAGINYVSYGLVLNSSRYIKFFSVKINKSIHFLMPTTRHIS